jgi:UDP-N-acetyl-2-amino-2-deoxyglucuronate dehydrogenase
MKNFGLIGAAGFVAARHMRAIRDTGNRLVAATDPNDSVGVLDSFSFDIRFFREIERFDRHLEKLRRGPEETRIHWISICSPNYLHDAHARLALRVDADAICEKPLVVNPWNLDALQALEQETERRIFTVLQLRAHPSLIALHDSLQATPPQKRVHVKLTYITARGPWYHVSWKGSEEQSGGIVTNIGIHFFDLLLWLFGGAEHSEVHVRNHERASGRLTLKNADVDWFLSVAAGDLPGEVRQRGGTTLRSITMDGEEIEFTDGFTDLHTKVYERTLAGDGFTIEDARPSIELAYRIRKSALGVRAT